MNKLNKILILVFISKSIFADIPKSNFPSELPILETKNLILRLVDLKDTDEIFQITCDPEVAKLTGMFELHKNKEETYLYIQNYLLKAFNNKSMLPWVVIHKETNKIIGFAGLLAFMPINLKAEIFGVGSKEFWNKGYATEGAKLIIKFGFEVLNLNRIHGTCDPLNIASQRVLEKCEMQFEGLLRNYIVAQGKCSDRKMYSIIKQEYFRAS